MKLDLDRSNRSIASPILAPQGRLVRSTRAAGARLLAATPVVETEASESGANSNLVRFVIPIALFLSAAAYMLSAPTVDVDSEIELATVRSEDLRRSIIQTFDATDLERPRVVTTNARHTSLLAPLHQHKARQKPAVVANLTPPIIPVAYHTAPRASKNSAIIARIYQIIKLYSPRHNNPQGLAERIVAESHAQGYDPIFVAAVIKSESTFNATARSNKGAQGLMQIMPKTGAWLAERNNIRKLRIYEEGHNLKLGIAYLKELEAEYGGDKVMTLVAYNWGPGHVLSATGGKRKIPPEVLTYAVKILNDYRRWRGDILKTARG